MVIKMYNPNHTEELISFAKVRSSDNIVVDVTTIRCCDCECPEGQEPPTPEQLDGHFNEMEYFGRCHIESNFGLDNDHTWIMCNDYRGGRPPLGYTYYPNDDIFIGDNYPGYVWDSEVRKWVPPVDPPYWDYRYQKVKFNPETLTWDIKAKPRTIRIKEPNELWLKLFGPETLEPFPGQRTGEQITEQLELGRDKDEMELDVVLPTEVKEWLDANR